MISKFIEKSKLADDFWISTGPEMPKLSLEISVLLALDHPNIVKVKDYFENESHFQMIMRESATENGRFAAKIFPAELFRVHCELGYDFVHRCRQEHEISVVLLRRKDTLAQAISLTRALQTRQWTSTDFKHARKPDYDFHRICQSLFYIHRSYEFWSTYAMTQAMPFEIICYEDLLDDPSPFLNHLAGELGVTVSGPTETKLGIQRDAP